MGDRPVECSQCKKPAKIIYKEVVDDSTLCSEMCVDCPLLAKKFPAPKTPENHTASPQPGDALCCDHCHTTLETIQMGNPLGCAECYSVFADPIVAELIQSSKIPGALKKNLTGKKSEALHVGRTPIPSGSLTSASKLTTLHESLNEALKKENYEQAASIRDQIKSLMDKANETA